MPLTTEKDLTLTESYPSNEAYERVFNCRQPGGKVSTVGYTYRDGHPTSSDLRFVSQQLFRLFITYIFHLFDHDLFDQGRQLGKGRMPE